MERDGWRGRLRWSVVVLATLVGASCSGADEPALVDPDDDVSADVGDDPGAGGDEPVSGDEVGVGDDTGPSGEAVDRDDTDTLVRAVVPGVTFEHPALWVLRADVPLEGAGTLEVVLDGPTGDTLATLRVTTVRTGDGELVDGLDPSVIDAIASVERGVDGGAEAEMSFVNGGGLRTASGADYRFVGATDDGVQVVELDAVVGDDSRIDRIDDLVRSLFVDGSAAPLAVGPCDHDVKVLSEVTVEGGTEVAPGALVTARWAVENTGACTWTSLDAWVFAGGDALEFTGASDLAGVSPGEEYEVSVTFRAPTAPGSYSTQWQFMPGGSLDLVGPLVPVSIQVV